METIATPPPEAQSEARSTNVHLAIVNLGDIIFHNKWFHSAGIGPLPNAEGKPTPDMALLTINLVSTAGMGEGFKMRGTVKEIAQAYTALMQQVGTIPLDQLRGAPIGAGGQDGNEDENGAS